MRYIHGLFSLARCTILPANRLIKFSKNLGQIISNCPAVRYRQLHFGYLAVLFLIFFCGTTRAQIRLSEQDLSETVSFYKTVNQANPVKTFQAKMPAPVTDEKIRKDILDNLPADILKLKIKSPEITTKLEKLLEPVLKLYKRNGVYEIIIIKHSTPLMMSDTGVVLVVSTGLLARVMSDDELLGYTAHEIGHEYFASYSIYSRHLLKLVAENGQETALNRKYMEAMAIIEAQCDAFAVLTLDMLGYNSLSFVEGFERTGRDFPNHSYGNHPPDEQRRKLVEQIAPRSNTSIKPRVSNELKALKDLMVTSPK